MVTLKYVINLKIHDRWRINDNPTTTNITISLRTLELLITVIFKKDRGFLANPYYSYFVFRCSWIDTTLLSSLGLLAVTEHWTAEQHTLRTVEWRVGEREREREASGNHWSASSEVIVQNSSRETKDCQFHVWLYKEVCRFESGSLWFLLEWKISWTPRRSSEGLYKLSTTARLTTCK